MLAAACSKYKYETVAGDPLNTRIYTLDNGLKVYMSVNKEAPRIQTYIAVKVGGKNDPAETTGLAHYFEHLASRSTVFKEIIISKETIELCLQTPENQGFPGFSYTQTG